MHSPRRDLHLSPVRGGRKDGGYTYTGSPGRGLYSASELGSPGGRVVDVERYVRDVPRTIYDQEAYDVVVVQEPVTRHEVQTEIETHERTEWHTEIELRDRTEWETVTEPVTVIKTRTVPRLVTQWVEEEYEDTEYETYERPITVTEEVKVDVPVTVSEDVEVDVVVPVTEWVTKTQEVAVHGSPVFEASSPGSPYYRSPRGFRKVPKSQYERSPLPRSPRYDRTPGRRVPSPRSRHSPVRSRYSPSRWNI